MSNLRSAQVIAAAASVLMAWMLAACETLPPVSVAPTVPTSITHHFSLIGRLSLRSGERLDSVKLIWLKSTQEQRLQFFSPFGSQLAEVAQVDGGLATLRQGKEVITAESIATITESLFGVALDTDEIGRWVQGAGLHDGEPRDLQLRDGSTWRVTAERMQTSTAPGRPDDIFRYAARLTAVKGDITIRLVVDEWRAL